MLAILYSTSSRLSRSISWTPFSHIHFSKSVITKKEIASLLREFSFFSFFKIDQGRNKRVVLTKEPPCKETSSLVNHKRTTILEKPQEKKLLSDGRVPNSSQVETWLTI